MSNLISPKRFVGLHCHSNASILDAIGTPNEHMDFVIENGMDAWAMTDHGNMNSYAQAWLYSQELKKKGHKFKFIPGIEFYINPDIDAWHRAKNAKADDNIDDSASDTAGVIEDENESKASKHFDPIKRRHHLVVLAKSQKGLKNLFRLVSRSYRRENFYKFPRIDYRMLKEFGEDLVVSSACLHPDSVILTSCGFLTIKEIVDKLQTDTEIYALSFNELDSKIEFKKVLWGECTRKKAKLIKIKLANGCVLKVTYDHKIFTDRGWLRADEIINDKNLKIFSIQ